MARSESQGLKDALGFGVAVISSEHWISASMSSPWSVAKFAKTPEDQAQVWKLFQEAAVASGVSTLIIGYLLGDLEAFLWTVAGSVLTLGFVYTQYQRALNGTL